jgi:hypothetical protein
MQSDPAENVKAYRLKNGNPVGNPHLSPRCGAKTRSGKPCRAPAMWSKKSGRYTKCKQHGGASTGPRTAEGRERCGKANWKHGRYSAEHKAERRRLRAVFQWMRHEGDALERELRAMKRARKRQQE